MNEPRSRPPLDWDDNVPWHALEVSEVEDRLGTEPGGLSPAEVTERLERFGANKLEEQAPTSPLVLSLIHI